MLRKKYGLTIPMNMNITREERIALEILRLTKLNVVDVPLLTKELVSETKGNLKKARAILSGVFSTAYKQGWCDENPVLRVETPHIQEKPIQPLSTEEITRLENTVETPEYQDMALSLHLMLYCGIRPKEVSRINPEQDIDVDAKEVIVRPSTSKTGGGRVVPLRKIGKLSPNQWQIPRNWEKRWRALRRAAQFGHWQQDACRHTFATYHARYFKNLHALQLEMGHSNLRLLLSRYIIANKGNAADFWQ